MCIKIPLTQSACQKPASHFLKTFDSQKEFSNVYQLGKITLAKSYTPHAAEQLGSSTW